MNRTELNVGVCCKADFVFGINMEVFEERIQKQFTEILAFEVEEQTDNIYLSVFVDKESDCLEEIAFEIITNTVWLKQFSCKHIISDNNSEVFEINSSNSDIGTLRIILCMIKQ